jgi:hypothetical protein
MAQGSLQRVREALATFAAAFDPELITVDDATTAVSEATRIEHIAATIKALAAAKVAASSAWRNGGHRSPADWLAHQSGTTAATARDTLANGAALQSLPNTNAKSRSGDLSPQQLTAIVNGATADPAAERELLDAAERESLGELRQRSQATKAAADPDPDATHERIHAGRAGRRFSDLEGFYNLTLRTTQDMGGRIEAELGPAIERAIKKARSEGRREPYEAYVADAIVSLLLNGGAEQSGSPKPRFLSLLRVDVLSLIRGGVEPGETCEIAGVGPVPVSVARDLLGESILKLVITNGVDVVNTTHLGRGANMAQQIALWWAAPACTVEGCSSRGHLQNDHRIPWAAVRRTELANLDPLCWYHHFLKTHDGWELVDGKGKRPFVPPEAEGHPKRKRDAAA